MTEELGDEIHIGISFFISSSLSLSIAISDILQYLTSLWLQAKTWCD